MKVITREQWHRVKTWRLAYPVMLTQLGQVLVGQADSIMVGRLGTIPLAAATLANSFFIVVLIFGVGVSYAMSPLVSKADGERDHGRISELLKHGLLINTLIAIVLMVIQAIFAMSLESFGQDPEVSGEARTYLFYLIAGMIPMMWAFSLRQFAEGLSDTKRAMRITLVTNAINIFLNYIFIFGMWGAPAMGLAGAGLATFLSRVIQALLMTGVIAAKDPFKDYWKQVKWRGVNPVMARRVLKLGIPSGLQMTFEVGAFAVAAIMTGWISPEAQAAYNIAIGLASISYMIASGIGAATTVRVGNQLGRRDISALKIAGVTGFKMTLYVMNGFGIVFLLGRNWLPLIYIDVPEVVQLASGMLIVATMFQLSDGQQAVALGALRGMHDVKLPTWITFISYWIVSLPLAYYLGIYLEIGAIGIWIALAIGLTLSALLLSFRFFALVKELKVEYDS